ncbi:DNA polymerase III subunit alpha [Desulfococcus multivorans]|nr:DNA polymerase III subunit alpha [Desulfococcus multivorans]
MRLSETATPAKTPALVPLVVRSGFSLMWGTATPAALCRRARTLGYRRLAMTDTDNLYGLWPFLAACDREGIQPIVGAEVTEPGSRRRAVCLVETPAGYANLCRILTRRHRAAVFDLGTAVAELGAGLTVLTGNPGLIRKWRDAGLTVAAAVPRYPVAAVHPLARAARDMAVPLVAVPGSFLLDPADAAVHRLLRAIAGNTTLSGVPSEDCAPKAAWLATPAVYARRFQTCPETIRATHDLAERLVFTRPGFGTIMPPWENGTGRGADAELRVAAFQGARQRYGQDLPEAVTTRLAYELRVIADKRFSAYFLVVRDIVAQSPRICGRGSGAASLTAYCLGITNVCPIKHRLYFERFLNPGRSDPPDIDIDFAWDERDAVLASVLGKFSGRAALVANHVLFQPRMAVRETARVFGLPEGEIRRVIRRVPRYNTGDGSLLDHIRSRPESRDLDLASPWPEIISLAERIIGLPRYLSVHPGGTVITPGPIDRYVPIETAPKGIPVIQWDKDGAEDAGLVKIDLLGNRSLAVIRDAVVEVRAAGAVFDERNWVPEDDPATRAIVAAGRTMGCFYIESPAMRLLQQKTGRGDFEHLVIHSSIIRPAAGGCIREYIRRLHGEVWTPIHPLLADVLGDTYGIMVYQEDVSKTAVALAGFSHADADRLRKILSKKDREYHLGDFRERFFAGALKRGVPTDAIERVWEMIMSFSGYSFCKPHSASYARVSFQAAYLKTHFPSAFMAAVISNQGGFYSTFAYVSEARRMGLKILPPDVRTSGVRWAAAGPDALRVGLAAVKGLTAETCRRTVVRRPFANLSDFLSRVRPDAAEARALVRCGALDGLLPGANRAALMWALARWEQQERSLSLFEDEATIPVLNPDAEIVRLRREFAVLGFLCDRHPMALFEGNPAVVGTVKADCLDRHAGRRVSVAGWLITGKTVRTRRGDPMEFLSFEDETGVFETVFFPEAYDRFCAILEVNRPYVLSGKAVREWRAVTLTVDGVRPLAVRPIDPRRCAEIECPSHRSRT